MKKEKEIRLLAENLEVRESEENNENMVVEGYAVVFNSPATHGFTEIIDKDAFNGCDMKDVCMKYNHDDSHQILARTRNNSLRLQIDDKGLFIHADLIDTTSNRDIYKMIQAGLLDKMSFAFTVEEEKWDLATDTRTILRIDRLFDVSVVDTPFYDTTSIYARALSTLENEKEKLENFRAKRELLQRKVSLILKVNSLKEVN
jgi:hypothetical protein